MDERQMSFFEEGGMTAPEVEVDAESGNEIPPGSLPEEVRDDVDAKLSGGEYVISADVLRYYGMKFFEDLRKQAKEELGEMDSEGRIGGEPTMEEGSELSPEEMAMLQEVMSQGQPEFNQGGMVLRNPELGYAEGGTVTPFNPEQWRDVGSSYFGNQQGQQGISVGSYYKTYVGPNGETQLILFVDGKPTTPIPEGFKAREEFVDQAKEEKATEASERKNDFNDGGESDSRRDEAPANTESWAERNYDALSNDPVAFGLSALDSGFGDKVAANAGRVGMALAGPIGALAGTAIGGGQLINNVASAKAALEIAKAQGQDTTPLETKIKEYEDGLPTRVKQAMDILDAGTGVNYLKDYEAVKARLGDQTEAVFRSTRSGGISATPAKSTTVSSTSTSARTGGESNDRPQGSAGARGVGQETATGNKAGAMTAAREAGVSAKTAAGLSGEQMSNPGGFDTEKGEWGTGPMNKGGLVKRRKKNTTKT